MTGEEKTVMRRPVAAEEKQPARKERRPVGRGQVDGPPCVAPAGRRATRSAPGRGDGSDGVWKWVAVVQLEPLLVDAPRAVLPRRPKAGAGKMIGWLPPKVMSGRLAPFDFALIDQRGTV